MGVDSPNGLRDADPGERTAEQEGGIAKLLKQTTLRKSDFNSNRFAQRYRTSSENVETSGGNEINWRSEQFERPQPRMVSRREPSSKLMTSMWDRPKQRSPIVTIERGTQMDLRGASGDKLLGKRMGPLKKMKRLVQSSLVRPYFRPL
jgi:hypothetical protein